MVGSKLLTGTFASKMLSLSEHSPSSLPVTANANSGKHDAGIWVSGTMQVLPGRYLVPKDLQQLMRPKGAL
jgi:hypothetical protein